MTDEQYLLACIAEEAAELAQAALKALRFGLDDVWPGKPTTNRIDLVQEANDLVGVLEMLRDLSPSNNFGFSREMVEAKKVKLTRMMAYSRGRNRLQTTEAA